MNKIEKANKYIAENKHSVKSRPLYHFAPPIGWMNDPNGFSYYNNEYHYFYQYYPYGTFWGDMHWGHAVSADLISWEHRSVAMANDRLYDMSGCFSGSAVEKDGELYLMYTGHLDPNLRFDSVPEQVVQQQCLAKYTVDGKVEKLDEINPVIGKKELPQGYQIRDFRDPKMYFHQGLYYVVLAARNEEGRGSILLYSSEDIENWHFVADIYSRPATDNILFECPDLFSLGGKDFLVLSLMPCSEKYKDIVANEVEYVMGWLDYEKGVFHEESRGMLDGGNSFYAPQTTVDKEGKRILIGWASNWSMQNSPHLREFGYNGMATIPRQMDFVAGKLVQKPVESLHHYEKIRNSFSAMELCGKFIFEKDFPSQRIHIEIMEPSSAFIVYVQDKSVSSFRFVFNPKGSLLSIESAYERFVDRELTFDYGSEVEIDIYIDNHLVELYLNGVPFTSVCYDSGECEGVTLESIAKIKVDSLVQYEISDVKIE